MSMAYGFYWGVFYPVHSPPYDPGGDDPTNIGSCFASVGQPEDYKGLHIGIYKLFFINEPL